MALLVATPLQAASACVGSHDGVSHGTAEVGTAHDAPASSDADRHGDAGVRHAQDAHATDDGERHCEAGCDAECAASSAAGASHAPSGALPPILASTYAFGSETAPEAHTQGLMRPPRSS